MNPMSLYMKIATLAYLCLVAGVVLRKKRRLHVPLMLTGMSSDVGVVLALELNRGALDTALSFALPILQQAHIGASLIAVLLYLPVIVLGGMRLRGRGGAAHRLWHIRLGLTAFGFRSIGFVLMFSFLF